MNRSIAPGPVMIDLEGPGLLATERDRVCHPNTGGIILFTRNYQSPEQVSALIRDVRAARNGALLIAVDHEGGRVQRFREGFSVLPPACAYAERCPGDFARALAGAENAAWVMATELLSVGVDFSFAPVLDVDSGISEIIGNRAFSRDAEQVATLAKAFRRGMRRAGMSAVGKHFPGHGGVALDSHLALPVDDRDFETIWHKDLLPFRALIEDGLEAVMPAHVIYSNVDDKPAGFSSHWIQTVLRGRLGFRGAIFSDDLSMEGAAFAGDFAARARSALQAGCDMVLVCNRQGAADAVLDALPIDAAPLREQRLMRMCARSAPDREALRKSAEWQAAKDKLAAM